MIDFTIESKQLNADSLSIEVLDAAGTVIYSTTNTAALLPKGEHHWQWDGYDNTGVLDTERLKNGNLTVRLTATLVQKEKQKEQVYELKLQGNANKADWVDVKIDRNAKTAEVTVRPSFKDGEPTGDDSLYKLESVSVPYFDLERMAKEGIEKYWSRDGSRPDKSIGAPVNTAKGAFAVTVVADVNSKTKPSAKMLELIELFEPVPGNFQRSNTIVNKVYHEIGAHYHDGVLRRSASSHPDQTILNQTLPDANGNFGRTAAHEFGHFILNTHAADGSGFPKHSSEHKGTSDMWQKKLPNNPYPQAGEIDLMKYYSSKVRSYTDYWDRSVAAEDDVKGLLWIARVAFK